MDAVDSVKRQTYGNWEIIIVDDGSTDNSHNLYKELGTDNRIHIFFNKENKGCGFTKRKCIEYANGQICGFLDADDTLINDALEEHINIYLSHPNVSIIFSKAHLIDTTGKLIYDTTLPDFSRGKTFFDYRWNGPMNFASFYKKTYNQTTGIDKMASAGIDQDLYFKLEEVGEIYPLDKFTYNYTIDGVPNSISHSPEKLGKLWYWNLIARRNACIRRQLDTDTIIAKDLQELIKRQRAEAAIEAENKVRNSLAYKIGYLILWPIKKIIKHEKNSFYNLL